MKIIRAKVVATSLDGMDFLDQSKLGKFYDIDLDSIRELKWGRSDNRKVWKRQSVWVLPGGWMPTELFEFEAQA